MNTNEQSEILEFKETTIAFEELKRNIYAALTTYSNVHRGSGHNSMVTTHLFEQAREIVLDYLGLSRNKYEVVFCTPRRAKLLIDLLKPYSFQSISSQDIGLPLGVRALAINRHTMPDGIPFQVGGGTANLISRDWVIWAKTPDKFEAGTPAIINIITFARALQLFRYFGNDAFHCDSSEKVTANTILYHDELKEYSGRELLYKLRNTLIGRGAHVPTIKGLRPFINLDNGASTPTFKPIWDAVCKAWQQPEQIKKEIIHEVKSICAEILEAPLQTYDVVFTSNTTEAINLVAESLRNESMQDTEPVVLNTILEHNSNELPWRMIPNVSLIRLSADSEGFMDLKELESLLTDYNQTHKYGNKRIKLVAMSGASNVLGVYNNIAEISKIVHRYDARLLVDAAQLVAHRKVSMQACEIDYLAFSAHKIYAPFGTGVLMTRKGLLTFRNDEMKLINASGEENIGGIAALGKSLVLLQRIGLDLIQEEEQVLTRKILTELNQMTRAEVFGIKDVNSSKFAHKGGVVVFNLKGLMANQVARKLAEQGIGVRYGCHCAHIIVKRLLNISPFLERFQHVIFTLFPKLTPPGVTRISLGLQNSEEDVNTLIQALNKISLKLHKPSSPTEFSQQMEDFIRTAAKKIYPE